MPQAAINTTNFAPMFCSSDRGVLCVPETEQTATIRHAQRDRTLVLTRVINAMR